jgi:hypothetical protein
MYSIQDDFVLDVVDSHPHALQYSAKQRAAMRISIPEVAEALGLSDKVIAALAEL